MGCLSSHKCPNMHAYRTSSGRRLPLGEAKHCRRMSQSHRVSNDPCAMAWSLLAVGGEIRLRKTLG